ncbi:MAG: hypothetical protein IPJ68_01190 [Candidatus Moraniibacteriota bacterium]|nr:MAG: hypothetical protein IPJ68_01190 [Candidatus Moranbacteria bacterium]
MRYLFRTLALASFSLPVVFLVSNMVPPRDASPNSAAFMTALAERDEEEHEDEEDEEHEEKDEDDGKKATQETGTGSKTKAKTVKVVKDVIEYRPIAKTVIVTEEAYATDTDGDLLVDAIDPDPKVPQNEYFTDTDGDGVPNAIDRHHDEDDFSYYEFETDNDNNGILDSYEE